MSFILDALRKSEHERQRQEGPGIADLRVASPARSRQTLWAFALGALLLINIAVVVALVWRSNRSPQPSAAPVAAASTSAAAAPATTVTAAGPAVTSAPPGVAAPGTSTPPVPAANPPTSPAPGVTDDTSSPVAADGSSEPTLRAVPQPLVPVPGAESGESYASLPTMGDVTLQGATLPELHLDLHVYASRPADRFVFINTRKYREGGQTPDGTTIERITPDGVVLNHHGVRYLLPRQ